MGGKKKKSLQEQYWAYVDGEREKGTDPERVDDFHLFCIKKNYPRSKTVAWTPHHAMGHVIRIVSDGTKTGTKVLNHDGVEIRNIKRIEIEPMDGAESPEELVCSVVLEAYAEVDMKFRVLGVAYRPWDFPDKEDDRPRPVCPAGAVHRGGGKHNEGSHEQRGSALNRL